MKLKGSCHCGAVRFVVESDYANPFNLCYCTICRKTAGGGGFAINLSADYQTLQIEGSDEISVYSAERVNADTGGSELSPAQRNFCKRCASALWVWDPRWPEFVYPFASAIDSDLPIPPERTHLMLDSKANWVSACEGAHDKCFSEYPAESIKDWHERIASNKDNA